MAQNTALQELSNDINEIISYSINPDYIIALNAIQNKIINYLPKEREQIIDSWDSAYGGDSNLTGVDYFTQTFTQNK